MRGADWPHLVPLLGRLVSRVAPLAETRWFGYVFGVAAVLLTTALVATGFRSRVANASALYTIPVLVTAARYGRAPALAASALAFFVFDWFFGDEPKLGPAHWPTLVVFLVTALIAGQLAAMLRQQAEQARQREREVVGLQQLAATLLQEHDFDRVLQAICQQLQGLTGAEGVAPGLLDERENVFELRAGVGPGAAARHGVRIPVEGSFAGEAVRTNQAQRSQDAQHDPRGYKPTLVPNTTHSILSVPMRTRQRVVGAISIFNKRGAPGFTDRDAELAMLFAQQAAVAIENARLYEETRGKAALEERQRLARELHDSVSQALYGIALNASAADELFEVAPERARGLLGDVLRLADAGLAEMRALIFELRPESLEHEGLVGALEKHAAAVRARHGLDVRLAVAGEPELAPRTKEALYRVAQEALHNAAKHARARTLELVLEVRDREVGLVVADDGRGFDPHGEFPGHLGLRSMRERAAAVGGTLEIQSAPGAGTRLSARVPLPAHDTEHSARQ